MLDRDPAGKVVRFGCGAVAGAVCGALLALSAAWVSFGGAAAAALVGAGLCGWLAMRHGDRFWEVFLRWGPWV